MALNTCSLSGGAAERVGPGRSGRLHRERRVADSAHDGGQRRPVLRVGPGRALPSRSLHSLSPTEGEVCSGRVRFTCAGWPSEPKWLTLPISPDLQARGQAERVNRTQPMKRKPETTLLGPGAFSDFCLLQLLLRFDSSVFTVCLKRGYFSF